MNVVIVSQWSLFLESVFSSDRSKAAILVLFIVCEFFSCLLRAFVVFGHNLLVLWINDLIWIYSSLNYHSTVGEEVIWYVSLLLMNIDSLNLSLFAYLVAFNSKGSNLI